MPILTILGRLRFRKPAQALPPANVPAFPIGAGRAPVDGS
jgi:hypothetical protein